MFPGRDLSSGLSCYAINDTHHDLMMVFKNGSVIKLPTRRRDPDIRISTFNPVVTIDYQMWVPESLDMYLHDNAGGNPNDILLKDIQKSIEERIVFDKKPYGINEIIPMFDGGKFRSRIQKEFEFEEHTKYIHCEQGGFVILKPEYKDEVLRQLGFFNNLPLSTSSTTRMGDEFGMADVDQRLFRVRTKPLEISIAVVDNKDRIGTLWTTMAGRTVAIPKIGLPGKDDGVYIRLSDGVNVVIRFDDKNVIALLKEHDIHLDQNSAQTLRTSKGVQDKLAELAKAKAELSKLKKEHAELLHTFSRTKEKHADDLSELKYNHKKNSVLDWFKTMMGSFGSEFKLFITTPILKFLFL